MLTIGGRSVNTARVVVVGFDAEEESFRRTSPCVRPTNLTLYMHV